MTRGTGVLGAIGMAMLLASCATLGPGAGAGPGDARPAALALPANQVLRMPWQPAPPRAGFIRQWLVCGEFPNRARPGAAAFDDMAAPADDPAAADPGRDYLTEHGGEAAIVPHEALAHSRPDGTIASWFRVDSASDVIDLKALLPGRPTDNSIVYAFAIITWPRDAKSILALGSDDGVVAYLNGQRVHTHIVSRAVKKDDDLVDIDLQHGDNTLLLKINNGGGDFGFCARILDPQALAPDSLTLKLAKDADDDELAVQLDYALWQHVPGQPAVDVEVLAPGGVEMDRQTARRGQVARFVTGLWPDGPYEVRATMSAPSGRRVTSYLPWYRGDIAARVRQILALTLPAADAQPDLRPRPGSVDREHLTMLAEVIADRLKIESADEVDLIYDVPENVFPAVQGALMEMAELGLTLSGQVDPARPDGFFRLAYRDEVDGSVQYGRVYLPPDYDPARPWPLVVSLHGYNPRNPPYVGWAAPEQRHHALARDYHVIVLEPHGRGNTGWRDIGEADLLRAIALTKEQVAVDDDRVLLLGYSMGGGGVWHVGTRHPDLFAAIAPVFGGWDYRAEVLAEPFGKLTPYEHARRERKSSFAQAEALWTTPVFVNHGDADELVDIGNTQFAVRLLQRWGYDLRYWEHPGKGHGGLGCEEEVMRWFLATRRDSSPAQVRVRSAWLKSAAAHWVAVEQRDPPAAFVRAEARLTGPNAIRLDTDNALEVSLTPAPRSAAGNDTSAARATSPGTPEAPAVPPLDLAQPVQVTWNGVARSVLAQDGRLVLRDDLYTPGALVKTRQREGPLHEAQNTPFAIVVGTTALDPAMRAACACRAKMLTSRWEIAQHVTPRVFLDTQLNDADLAKYTLILIGRPADNLIARRLADSLPLAFAGDTVTLAGRAFAAPRAAVQMIYPHPLNAQRYVVIQAATHPAAMLYLDDIDDEWDFGIVDGRIAEPDAGRPDEKVLLAGGWFGYDWQLDERALLVGDPAARAAAPLRKVARYYHAPAEARALLLSDLIEARTEGYFDTMKRDRNYRSAPLVLAGRRYASGLAANVRRDAVSAVDFALDGAWKRLKGTIGIELSPDLATLEPKYKERTRVIFVVSGDGRELYRSPGFRWDAPPRALDVDVTGVRMLRLELTGEGRYNAAISADWADVRVER